MTLPLIESAIADASSEASSAVAARDYALEALAAAERRAGKCPYRPMEFNVVVELDPTEKVTKGGIILVENHVEREKLAAEEGTLVAISPLAFSYASPGEWGDEPKPQVGQRVMIKRYDGVLRDHEIDGLKRSFRIVPDKSIVAVIEGDE